MLLQLRSAAWLGVGASLCWGRMSPSPPPAAAAGAAGAAGAACPAPPMHDVDVPTAHGHVELVVRQAMQWRLLLLLTKAYVAANGTSGSSSSAVVLHHTIACPTRIVRPSASFSHSYPVLHTIWEVATRLPSTRSCMRRLLPTGISPPSTSNGSASPRLRNSSSPRPRPRPRPPPSPRPSMSSRASHS